MFSLYETQLPGCLEIVPTKFQDQRGSFVKTFHAELFAKHGLATDFREQYYSVSARGSLRGMHFQIPPHDHDKLVYCIDGEVLDVVLDLRKGSPSFGAATSLNLSSEKANMVYVPRGLAHGFYVLSAHATMVYNVTSCHSPDHDSGIHWRSVPVSWPSDAPVVSDRDSLHPTLEDFASPFIF